MIVNDDEPMPLSAVYVVARGKKKAQEYFEC
jgi:hypothetical protein